MWSLHVHTVLKHALKLTGGSKLLLGVTMRMNGEF